jgi:hypothetical protein
MTSPQDVFTAAYKPVVHAISGALSMSLTIAGRNCEIASKAINDSLSEAARMGNEIDAAQDITTLFEIQARLARAWFESASRNWYLLCEAAGENQLEMLRRGQAEVARIGDDIRAAALKGVPAESSIAGAWGPFMQAASSACAIGVRATEELTRMAVAQGAAMEASSKRAGKAAARPS